MADPLEPHSAPAKEAAGKRLLLDAAAHLAAQQGSTHALGIRELARQAGLNHNTFYRHFESIDAMVGGLIDQFRLSLRQGLRQARAAVRPDQKPSRVVMGWLFDFALAHRDIFVVAFREQFGPPSAGREAVRSMIDQLCEDSVADLSVKMSLTDKARQQLTPLLRMLIGQDFVLCMQFLESPGERERLLAEAEILYETLLAGALVLHGQISPKK